VSTTLFLSNQRHLEVLEEAEAVEQQVVAAEAEAEAEE
jgi:hypothetical protein